MMAAMAQLPSSALRPPTAINYSIPPSQNTAPVLDFDCLFTYDVRRKAKRWHDGSLRFHTFNHRVMVYDEERNLVGDTHERKEIQNGDEFPLEKNGAIVQVGEQQGATQTDLSELLKKRARPDPSGRTQAQAQSPGRSFGIARQPLHQESPYSMRQRQEAFQRELQERRSRRRPELDDEHTPLWQILKRSTAALPKPSIAARVPLAPSGATNRSKAKLKTASKSKSKRIEPGDNQPRLNVKEIIEIPSDEEANQGHTVQQPHIEQERHDIAESDRAHSTGQENEPPIRQGWFAKPPHLAELSSPSRTRAEHLAAFNTTVSRHKERVISMPNPVQPRSVAMRQLRRPAGSPRRSENALAEPAMQHQQRPSYSSSKTTYQHKKTASPGPPHIPSSPPVSTTSHIVDPPGPDSVNLAGPSKSPSRRILQEDVTERPVKQLRLQPQAPRPMLFCQTKPPPRPRERAILTSRSEVGNKLTDADFDDLSDELDKNDDASSSSFDDLELDKVDYTTRAIAPPAQEQAFDRPAPIQHRNYDPPDYSHLDAQLIYQPPPAKPSPATPPAPLTFASLAPVAQPSSSPSPDSSTASSPNLPNVAPSYALKAPVVVPPAAANDNLLSAAPAPAAPTISPATTATTGPPTIKPPPIISALRSSCAPPRRIQPLHNPIRPQNHTVTRSATNPTTTRPTSVTAAIGSNETKGKGTAAAGDRDAANEGEVAEKRQWPEKGPWSIEAWDLLGCVYWPERERA